MKEGFFDLTGKKAVVTGAGRGLGRGVAVALARYGADVMLWSRTVSELEETAALVRAEGRQAGSSRLTIVTGHILYIDAGWTIH